MIHPIRGFEKLPVSFGIATHRSWIHGATSLYGATRCITSISHLRFFSKRENGGSCSSCYLRRQWALGDTYTANRTTKMQPCSEKKKRRNEPPRLSYCCREINVHHSSQIDGFGTNGLQYWVVPSSGRTKFCEVFNTYRSGYVDTSTNCIARVKPMLHSYPATISTYIQCCMNTESSLPSQS
jgi:hypothetical protein